MSNEEFITFCGGGINCTIGIVGFFVGWLDISSRLRRFFGAGFTADVSTSCGYFKEKQKHHYLTHSKVIEAKALKFLVH